jgi:hypothetical protein
MDRIGLGRGHALDDETMVEAAVRALRARHPDLSERELKERVKSELVHYRDARVKHFLPILLTRAVERDLRRAS